MTTKTTTAAKAATPKKRATAKTRKPPRLDLDRLTVSKTEMAHILGLAAANITALIQNGGMTEDEDGRLNLRDNVREYCQRMRERKAGDSRSKSDIETETAKLKLDNLRIKNRDWRMTRDRQVATEIINRLSGAMISFREQAKLNPALVDAIDELISNIGTVNVDDISVIVEGDDEEDDD